MKKWLNKYFTELGIIYKNPLNSALAGNPAAGMQILSKTGAINGIKVTGIETVCGEEKKAPTKRDCLSL